MRISGIPYSAADQADRSPSPCFSPSPSPAQPPAILQRQGGRRKRRRRSGIVYYEENCRGRRGVHQGGQDGGWENGIYAVVSGWGIGAAGEGKFAANIQTILSHKSSQ